MPRRHSKYEITSKNRQALQIAIDTCERQSAVYTTKIESGGWGRVFGDPNIAAAIIDRTVA